MGSKRFIRFRCDGNDCGRHLDVPISGNFHTTDKAGPRLNRRGWIRGLENDPETGSTVERHYCPDCKEDVDLDSRRY